MSLAASGEFWGRFLRQRQVVLRVRPPNLSGPNAACVGELVGGILADSLEQLVAQRARGTLGDDKALADKRREDIGDVIRVAGYRCADGLGCLQVPAPDEHPQAAQ